MKRCYKQRVVKYLGSDGLKKNGKSDGFNRMGDAMD
jgi:hypothetical protein